MKIKKQLILKMDNKNINLELEEIMKKKKKEVKKVKKSFILFLFFGIIFLLNNVLAITTIENTNVISDRINGACYVQVNNATDLQTQVTNCASKYIIIPYGTYTLTTPLLLNSGITLEGQSQYTTIDCSGLAESCIKSTGARIYQLNLKKFRIVGASTFLPNSIGLNLNNISASRFDSLDIYNFETGISAGRNVDAALSYYNNFYDLKINSNNVNINLENHANENKFFGGYSTGSISNITVNLTSGVDNNQFIGFSFEGDKETIVMEDTSWQNSFLGCRLECSVLAGCTVLFNSNGNSWIGGLLTSGQFDDNGERNIVLHNGKYDTSYTGIGISVPKGTGSFGNLTINNTLKTNVITPWVRAGSIGDLILSGNSPTSSTTGRLIFKTMSASNVETQRILINNYYDTADIDITNARLDMNTNNITNADYINANEECFAPVIYANNSVKTNYIEDRGTAYSTAPEGDLIIRTQQPTSTTVGRIIFQTRNSSNSLVNRILVTNYADISDIDITNARLDMNSNNITTIGSIQGNLNVNSGNITVTQNNKICLDYPTCSHSIYYNGSATIIE